MRIRPDPSEGLFRSSRASKQGRLSAKCNCPAAQTRLRSNMYLKNFNGNTSQNKKLRTSANVFRADIRTFFCAVLRSRKKWNVGPVIFWRNRDEELLA